MEVSLNNMQKIIKKEFCRICGNMKLRKVLDLGTMPPANNFLRVGELKKPEQRFPLAVQFCEKCFLLSLCHVVDSEILFKNYHYLTGASAPLAKHFTEEARMIYEKLISDKNDLVVEFGSNDGVLLSALKEKCRVLGVDPAKNVASFAMKQGVETVTAFFSEKTARKIKQKYGEAKVIVANNVFAHIDDIHNCMRGIALLLRPDGVFISESHWVGNLVGGGGFDQIYHEHLSYYSLYSMKYLASIFGLVITKVEIVPIHGESIRVFMKKRGVSEDSAHRLLALEKKLGLTKIETFQRFSKGVAENRDAIKLLLKEIKRSKKTVAGYGAPAKGNTLLHYFGIGKQDLLFVTDTTIFKQGLLTPGAHIPVVSPGILKTNPPDYLLLLSWNYADAILEKERDLREQGVKFIIPVPKVRVV